MGPRTYVLATLAQDPLVAIEAAALRLPPDAVFAGLAAAWLHGLDVRLARGVETLLVHDGGISSRASMHVGRAEVDECEVVVRRGFRVTNMDRTLADIAATLPLTQAVVIADMALHAGVTDLDQLAGRAASRAGRRGIKHFRRVLELADPNAESPMETRLRLLLVLGGLPRPESQVELRDASGVFLGRADLYCPNARLVIEYDGDGHRSTLTEDNRRQNRLVEAGYKIFRFTAPDIYNSPELVVARVRAALAAAAAYPPRPAAGAYGAA